MTDLTIDLFLKLEAAVWDALVAGDPEADRLLLSPDFLGVYTSGFSDRSEHADQLIDGPTVARYKISEALIRTLTDDHVLLSYRADYHRVSNSEITEPDIMYVSSLWSRNEDGWVNVFSQDTPAEAPA